MSKMSKKSILRIVSFAMLAIAVIFVLCALSAPNLGRAIYIGPFRFGAKQWRVCYAIYAAVMAGLFIASFFASGRKR